MESTTAVFHIAFSIMWIVLCVCGSVITIAATVMILRGMYEE